MASTAIYGCTRIRGSTAQAIRCGGVSNGHQSAYGYASADFMLGHRDRSELNLQEWKGCVQGEVLKISPFPNRP